MQNKPLSPLLSARLNKTRRMAEHAVLRVAGTLNSDSSLIKFISDKDIEHYQNNNTSIQTWSLN